MLIIIIILTIILVLILLYKGIFKQSQKCYLILAPYHALRIVHLIVDLLQSLNMLHNSKIHVCNKSDIILLQEHLLLPVTSVIE